MKNIDVDDVVEFLETTHSSGLLTIFAEVVVELARRGGVGYGIYGAIGALENRHPDEYRDLTEAVAQYELPPAKEQTEAS